LERKANGENSGPRLLPQPTSACLAVQWFEIAHQFQFNRPISALTFPHNGDALFLWLDRNEFTMRHWQQSSIWHAQSEAAEWPSLQPISKGGGSHRRKL
jgi:hypothetical protein